MSGQNHARIGTILKDRKELSDEQVAFILEHQEHHPRPFGELAEHLYGVSHEAVEQAWVEQYLSYGTRVDLRRESVDRSVLGTFSRRQAWQFQLVPLRCEDGRLLVATTAGRLPRGAAFAWRIARQPVFLLVAPESQIITCLAEHYPWPEMSRAKNSYTRVSHFGLDTSGDKRRSAPLEVITRDVYKMEKPVVAGR